MKYFLQLVLFIALVSCNNDIALIVPNNTTGSVPLVYEEKLEVSYGKDVLQTYDLYLPNTRNERNPVLILLHPGAWKLGDKTAINSIVKAFMAKRVNCAIVNANYRLTSSVGITYNQQLDDINNILLKLKSDSKILKFSTNFFLIGLSSGGHLAMLYANSPRGNKLAKGIAGIVPPVNLTSQAIRDGLIGADIAKLIGKTYTEAPNEYLNASPIFQYNIASPPTIVFFGGKDDTVPREQANICREILLGNRVKSEFNLYPNEGHEWKNWTEPIDKIINFAEKNL